MCDGIRSCCSTGASNARKRPRVKLNGHSQTQLTAKSPTRQFSSSPQITPPTDKLRGSSDTLPTLTSELTSVSLAQLESGGLPPHHKLLAELQMRTPPSRKVGADGEESELEISQKTWSAYETLPQGLMRFGDEGEEPESDRESQNSIDDTHMPHPPQEDIDTLDNDAYSSTAELESLRRPTERGNSRMHLLPGHLQRVSTISTTSSTSGYVISSLNSPTTLRSPWERDRTSCYSTGSDGYVINSLEWVGSRPVGPAKPPLPRIPEDCSSISDYLQIVPS